MLGRWMFGTWMLERALANPRAADAAACNAEAIASMTARTPLATPLNAFNAAVSPPPKKLATDFAALLTPSNAVSNVFTVALAPRIRAWVALTAVVRAP